MITHSNSSKMNIILPTCLQRNYRDSLGEFSDTSCGVFGAERVNRPSNVCRSVERITELLLEMKGF